MGKFKNMPKNLSREEKILEVLKTFASSLGEPIKTTIARISKQAGLSFKDTCLGLIKLWLVEGKICVRGFLPVDNFFEIRIASPFVWEGKRGNIGGDREGSREIKINFLKNKNATKLLRQRDNPGSEVKDRIKQKRERKEVESVREGERKESIEPLLQKLGKGKEKELYEKIAGNYPVEVVKVAVRKTLEVPEEKIKKTRLALFRFLLKKYLNEKIRHECLLEKVINSRDAKEATSSTLNSKSEDVTMKEPAGKPDKVKVESGKAN